MSSFLFPETEEHSCALKVEAKHNVTNL